jgi:hypothetical protein
MRINTSATLVALSCISINTQSTLGFTVQSTKITAGSTTTQLSALTHKDILNRARKAVGQPEIEDAPEIFDDNLLEDIQASLLILEKRVKNGPGSLSGGEVQEFKIITGRILSDHDEFIKNGGSSPDQGKSLSASPLVTPRNANAGGEAKSLVENLPAATGPAEVPHNSEEGSEYDGTGGMGLAKGTTNTWVIPGMDEMTGEEYRQALQESVSSRQSMRREGDVTGNLSSNNYLDNL